VRFEGGRDALGRAYEVLLGRFARAEGRRGGQFYTPRCVVRLLAALVGPVAGRRVYDPCCGSGGMFVHGAAGAAEIFGQESNPGTWRLARQNLALRGVNADLGSGPADSFLDDRHPGRLADVVLANPPFHQSDWGADRLRDDPRWRYGVPPAGNGNFAWVQHILAHLAPGGTAAIVLSNSSLSATKAGEGAIRRGLGEAGWVDAVVALPPQLFHATPIPACVWLLCDARPDTTLFVDARSLGRRADRTHRELPPEAVDRVAAVVRTYRAGSAVDEPGFAAVRTREDLAAHRWAFTPARHVERAPGAESAPARDRIRALAAEWRALRDEADRLAADIEEAGLGL